MEEAEGFAEFVRAHSRALLRAGWLLTGDWAAAEDLVQTALALTWPRWDRAAHDGTPLAYVRAILTNSYLRSRRRRWIGEIATASLPEPEPADVLGGGVSS